MQVVFLGPSLPRERAVEILPGAVYLPPARQGDVFSALAAWRPEVIGIIDGVFLDTLSVWHKEILCALEAGVPVYGAASMGALRAAECAAFGMEGVGRIFEWYRDGVLERDDEVAVAHADAEHGYRPLSEPLVNIRATLAAAAETGLVEAATHDRLVDLAAATHFPDRSWQGLLSQARLDPATAEQLRCFVSERHVDQKRLDAEALLRLFRDGVAGDATRPDHDFELATTHYLSALIERDRWVERDGTRITLESIARHVLVNDPDAGERIEKAMLTILASHAARNYGVDVDDEDVQAEFDRFRKRHSLETDEDLEAYLSRNDLHRGELMDLMRRQALKRKGLEWARVMRFKLGTWKLLLDELRLDDEYADWADDAALVQSIVGTGPDGLVPPFPVGKAEAKILLAHHRETTGFGPPGRLAAWARVVGFDDTRPVLSEIKKTAIARQRLDRAAAAAADIDL